MKYYLAYGSNLNKGQMARRCPTAKAVGTAWIDGYELLFKGEDGWSFLTIEKAEGKRVPVGVWKVTDSDEQSLDRYEGYPAFYYKKDVEIKLKGRNVTAFVYIMHEDNKLGKPSIHYLQTCLQGYRDFGFSNRYLEDAQFRNGR